MALRVIFKLNTCTIPGTTKRVILAAICGSMICALLLVILLGCSCKLYAIRHVDHALYPRYETPMSRLYAELLRRRAPPPYHEAMLTSRNFDEVQQEYLERLQNATRRHRSHRRRSTRNQQTTNDGENRPENTETNENPPQTDSNNMQMANVSERTENSNSENIDRTSSTAELLPSDSETDSSDLDDDLDSEDEVTGEGQGENTPQGHAVIDGNRNIEDDDDENILLSGSLSAQWARNVDSDNDDACILMDETLPEIEQGQGHCDNASIDTEASVSIISMETQETNTLDLDDKSSDDEHSALEELQNSRNSTPKPETTRENQLIETRDGFLMRGSSQNSLDSAGSETFDENDVPLSSMDNVSQV